MEAAMRQKGIAWVLLLGLLLGACSFGETPDELPLDVPNELQATAAGDHGVITFAVGSLEQQAYEPFVARFNAENADLQVQIVPIDPLVQADGTAGILQRLRQIASGADTAVVPSLPPEADTSGLFADLRPLMNADAGFDQSDFFPAALAGLNQSSIYLLPHTLKLPLLAYNRERWTEAGLPTPKPDWSWADLVSAAEQLARKRGDNVEAYGLLELNGYAPLMSELSQTATDQAPITQGQLQAPVLEAALEQLQALVASGALYVPPQPNGTVDINTVQQLTNDGRVGMWGTSTLEATRLPSANIGFALAPLNPSVQIVRQGYVMSSGTQHQAEAWRWLSFLSGQLLPQAGTTVIDIPARTSLATQSGYWEKLDVETSKVVRAALARESSPPPAPALQQALEQAATGVLANNEPITTALQAAQTVLGDAPIQPAVTAAPVAVATPLPQTGGDKTVITFDATNGNSWWIDEVARAFNAENADLVVRTKNWGMGFDTKPFADVAQSADCFLWNGVAAVSTFTPTLDIQPLIDADPSFDLSDYPPAFLYSLQRDGKRYGLPLNAVLLGITYNAKAFAEAGLKAPSSDWTFDDLLNAAEQLTRGEGNERFYGFAAVGGGASDVLPFLPLFDAQVIVGRGMEARPNFTDEKVVQAVGRYLDLLRYSPQGKTLNGWRSPRWPEDTLSLPMENDRVGFWVGYGTPYVIYGGSGGATSENIAVAPPLLDGRPLPTEWAASDSGVFISASSQHPEACWTWLKFLSEQPIPPIDGIPARRSVAEGRGFLAKALPGTAELYAAYDRPLHATPAEMSEPVFRSQVDLYWFFQAIERAWQGGNLDQELEKAQTTTETFVGCLRAAGAAQVAARAANCAAEADPEYTGQNSPTWGQRLTAP